jgi:hypothetical protein
VLAFFYSKAATHALFGYICLCKDVFFPLQVRDQHNRVYKCAFFLWTARIDVNSVFLISATMDMSTSGTSPHYRGNQTSIWRCYLNSDRLKLCFLCRCNSDQSTLTLEILLKNQALSVNNIFKDKLKILSP